MKGGDSSLSQSKDTGRDAFCATCPSVQEVTQRLQNLGFRLVFEMPAGTGYRYAPPMPAQFHYRDQHHTEVIYLAGHDANIDGQRFPPHASRWWIYPGTNINAYHQAAQVLSLHWSLSWRFANASHLLNNRVS